MNMEAMFALCELLYGSHEHCVLVLVTRGMNLYSSLQGILQDTLCHFSVLMMLSFSQQK